MSLERFVENNECIICLDIIDIENQQIEFFKDCDHTDNYHYICVNNWIKQCITKNIIPTCPICRKEIKIREIPMSIENDVSHNYIQVINNNYESRSRFHCIHICCCVSMIIVITGLICINSIPYIF